MDAATSSLPAAEPLQRRRPAVPPGVLATLIFVVTEVMFFTGCISAFTIVKAGTSKWMWPPPGQPRLPAEATLVNTGVLLLSGVLMVVALRRYRRKAPASARLPLWAAWALGAAFVGLQGYEWQGLLRQGLTLTSSSLGSFFYLIVGGHALHAVIALAFLGAAAWKLQKGTVSSSFLFGAQVFWAFVVLMWPVIYLRVYFG